jgi:hypothetical protein
MTFERKTGIWCDFNDHEQEMFAQILDLAESNVEQAHGPQARLELLMMTGELRRVFQLKREPWIAEDIRAQIADHRRSHHVSNKIVRCARDGCGEVQEATAALSAWRMARTQEWKLNAPGNETSTDLLCPEHAEELGKTQ